MQTNNPILLNADITDKILFYITMIIDLFINVNFNCNYFFTRQIHDCNYHFLGIRNCNCNGPDRVDRIAAIIT